MTCTPAEAGAQAALRADFLFSWTPAFAGVRGSEWQA
jgi:hypothetical protein